MISHADDNKKVAKNTLFLYLRMLFSVAVSLFTVRIVWRELGIEDYGIYNVVAGVVMMFQFLNSAMVGSTQRFLAYAIGKRDSEGVRQTFTTSVKVHYQLAFVIFILAETIGLWFLCTAINIPEGRVFASHCVYQASVISFVLMVVSVPYNAAIVAYEDMKVFGLYGILEVVLKFLAAVALMIIAFDRLIAYASFLLVISIVMRLIYVRYCRNHFPDCKYDRSVRATGSRDMFSFAGWTMLGSFGVSGREQGLNIILNMFFNVAYNAAKGIANQVSGVIMGFTYNFQMSMFPQITKRYASGEIPSMLRLVFAGCQISYFLLLIVSVPLMFRAEYVLSLWLGEGVSKEMVIFLDFMLLALLVDCMKGPVAAALQATGDVKAFQIMVFVILISALPMAWIWLELDNNPYSVIYVTVITNLIAIVGRFYLLHRQIGFHGQGKELIEISLRIVCSSTVYFAAAYIINPYISFSFMGLVAFSLLMLLIGLVVIFAIGFTNSVRAHVFSLILSRLKFKM